MKSKFGSLPLFWKLLVPFMLLILVLGTLGAFLIVRNLSSQAQRGLDQDLLRYSLDARSIVHDRELYLLESANFAANLQGMAEAAKDKDPSASATLLRSVHALKSAVSLLAVASRDGTTIAQLASTSSENPVDLEGPDIKGLVIRALQEGTKSADLVNAGPQTLLAIAAPICGAGTECSPEGVAVVGMGLDRLVAEARGVKSSRAVIRPSVAVYSEDGMLIGESGRTARRSPPKPRGSELVRRTETVGGTEVATLYSPLEVQGRKVGTLSVTIPAAPAFASVRGAGIRLALVLLAGMLGIVAIGALLSRFILSQVRPLLETSRALGTGQLSERAPVLMDDELGELAKGLNQMAEQLESSYETLELRVAQRTQEVRRLLRERTDFFTGISHEFRTPLAVILSQAEMMLDAKYPRKENWTSDAGRAFKDSGQQLLTLVNDILDLAKAEAGEIQVHFEEVSIAELLRELRRTMQSLANSGDLDFSLHLPRQLPQVWADPMQTREIILNLVDNAVKYTPPGGSVDVSVVNAGDKVSVSVCDTGVGIPEESAGRIFEPFYTVPGTEPQQRRASSGLGLALAKRLVEAQGGEIIFKTQAGKGTTFTFTLNVVPALKKPSKGDKPRARLKHPVGT